MSTIGIAIISSGALSALISGIFQVILNRKGRIRSALAKVEKDALRTQMLVMMSDYPHERQEILTLAKRYFVDLKGDWYLTSLFNGWMEREQVTPPTWFNKEG